MIQPPDKYAFGATSGLDRSFLESTKEIVSR
jgi:hypothetical protein